MTDYEIGIKALRSFYSFWKNYSSSSKYSFEDMIAMLKARRPMGGNAFIDGLGTGIRLGSMSDSRVTAAMRNLALDSAGRLPSANMDFFSYLTNEAVKINWVDAIGFTVVESAKDVVGAAQAVGDSVITTGKVLRLLLPLVILFFVFLWLNRMSGGEVEKYLSRIKL